MGREGEVWEMESGKAAAEERDDGGGTERAGRSWGGDGSAGCGQGGLGEVMDVPS